MNNDFLSFLSAQGAHIESGCVHDFSDAAAELQATRNGTVICDLSQYGRLRAAGEDTQTFLQNMLSNDVQAVGQHAQYASLNTAKGRMLGLFLLWKEGDDYVLHLPRPLVPAIQKRLSMFVLRSKVKLTDSGAESVALGIAGPQAEAVLQPLFAHLPSEPLGVAQQPGVTLIRLDMQRFMLHTDPQTAQTLWMQLKNSVRPVGSACWDWLEIQAGLPQIYPATQEQFVPQMVNLELIGGISFKKGCYPGQEIVARMHYLGKPKRRMYLAHLDGTALPQPGDLLAAHSPDEPPGMIVRAAPSPEGGSDLLAVVPVASHDQGEARLPGGTPLQFQPLPYPFP
ncbi:MAG: folate-binding protein [Pseudomonadota bacterium]